MTDKQLDLAIVINISAFWAAMFALVDQRPPELLLTSEEMKAQIARNLLVIIGAVSVMITASPGKYIYGAF